MADVSRHVIDKFGEGAWGMKTFSYQYFENTYAISKLAFESIATPAYAPHDKPGPGNDTAGVDDASIITFSASNEDWSLADVVFISGTDPFETKTILFTEWMMKGHPNKIIMVLPRKTTGAAYAEKIGGLFLQIIPGTDTTLHMALARLILENGWQDQEFIDRWVANRWEIDSGFGRGTRNTPWQWRTTWGRLGASYKQYRDWLLSNPDARLARASAITGIPARKIRAAAEMIARPVNGQRPKTSFGFEKGNYWSNNYLNTASYASLALLCGAGNRPGRVLSRDCPFVCVKVALSARERDTSSAMRRDVWKNHELYRPDIPPTRTTTGKRYLVALRARQPTSRSVRILRTHTQRLRAGAQALCIFQLRFSFS